MLLVFVRVVCVAYHITSVMGRSWEGGVMLLVCGPWVDNTMSKGVSYSALFFCAWCGILVLHNNQNKIVDGFLSNWVHVHAVSILDLVTFKFWQPSWGFLDQKWYNGLLVIHYTRGTVMFGLISWVSSGEGKFSKIANYYPIFFSNFAHRCVSCKRNNRRPDSYFHGNNCIMGISIRNV